MSSATPTVFVVDDDPQVCESLSLMVRSVGLNVETYASAEAFLDGFREVADVHSALSWMCGCPDSAALGFSNSW